MAAWFTRWRHGEDVVLAVIFRMRNARQRPLRCALYRVRARLELRMEYEDASEVLQTETFRVGDHDAILTTALNWRRLLRTEGFEDLPDDPGQ